ncbi:RHS repeat-associated core domain-containing protein, partial [Yersinia similis]
FSTQDPIGLAGGVNLYAYVPNPLGWVDPLGLTAANAPGFNVYGLFDPGATKPYYVGITDDLQRRSGEHVTSGRLNGGARMKPLDQNITYGQARGYEQFYIDEFGTKTGVRGEDISPTNRGNKINSYDRNNTTRDPTRQQYFDDAYDSKKSGTSSKGGGGC